MSDDDLPGLADAAPTRKSASHGEAGYARVAREAYFTEAWVTRALLGAVDLHLGSADVANDDLVWEPAVGAGYIADVLRGAGYCVVGSDIHDYGWYGTRLLDFTRAIESDWPGAERWPAAIVTNPPFDLAREFVSAALRFTRGQAGKVAILQRHEFDAPQGNADLFKSPFAAKLILPRRPHWYIWDPATRTAEIPLGKDGKPAAPRFPYAWYLWDWRHQGEPAIRRLADPGKGAAPEGLL